MKKSELRALAQTLFLQRPDETRKFEKLLIEHYLLNVRIQDECAMTSVEMVFFNPNEHAAEGVFIFPCPKQTEIWIDGKVIPTKLAKKEKIKAIYGNALQSTDADLLDALGSSFLQTKVLQIPAGGTCPFRIDYVEYLEETDGNFTYTHHLKSEQKVKNFGISLFVHGRTEIDTINSSSHDVTIDNEPDQSPILTYKSTGVQLDKDFVCTYSLTERQRTAAELLASEESFGLSELSSPDFSRERFDAVTVSPAKTMATTDSFEQERSLRLKSHNTRGADRLVERSVLRRQTVSRLGLTPPNGSAYRDVYFKGHGTNPFIDTEDDNFSTFAMDTDSASYSVMRRFLPDGNLPEPDSVRVEEFINAFNYNYKPPTEEAFAIHMKGAPSKFGSGKRLQMVRIGIQGKIIEDTDRKDANLTFVIDVSGSMGMENRLGLVKRALRLLVEQLRPNDKIGIVVYGTNARVVLPHTSAVNSNHILKAIDALSPEGVTNVEDGIHKGYELASKNAEKDCINRVILCSDGVANEGVTDPDMLLKEIRDYVEEDDIYLTTVGFGMGNYNDVLMEELAKKGNGNYAYVDTLKEAKRIFVENLTGTLQVIAKDAKIQVEFNEDTVSRFRLLGYENRQMKHEDFRNDKADAGEIGSGHSVTALYEVKLCKNVDEGELATVFIRHEDPDTAEVTEVNEKIFVEELKDAYEDTSQDFQVAASVAQFAEILRESYWAKDGSLGAVQRTLKGILSQLESKNSQSDEQKRELFSLVRKARRLMDLEAVQTS